MESALHWLLVHGSMLAGGLAAIAFLVKALGQVRMRIGSGGGRAPLPWPDVREFPRPPKRTEAVPDLPRQRVVPAGPFRDPDTSKGPGRCEHCGALSIFANGATAREMEAAIEALDAADAVARLKRGP